jgi:hypothetical protein
MSLRAPFPWLPGDSMRVRCADAEVRCDVFQQGAARSHRSGVGNLFVGESGASGSPFSRRAPRSCSAVGVRVLDILRACGQFEIRRPVVGLIKVPMIDLLIVGNVSVDVRPHHAVRADASELTINRQHHAQVAFAANGLSAARCDRDTASTTQDGVSPNPAFVVDGKRPVSDQIHRAIDRCIFHNAILPRNHGNGWGMEVEW